MAGGNDYFTQLPGFDLPRHGLIPDEYTLPIAAVGRDRVDFG